MGQQQLLLLALSAIIVGLSIVVGFNMFRSNAAQANTDAVINDVLSIAARAQGWIRKPLSFGGGGGDFTNSDTGPISMEILSYQVNASDEYINDNGTFTITPTSATQATITGVGTEDPDGGGLIQVITVVSRDSVVSTTVGRVPSGG